MLEGVKIYAPTVLVVLAVVVFNLLLYLIVSGTVINILKDGLELKDIIIASNTVKDSKQVVEKLKIGNIIIACILAYIMGPFILFMKCYFYESKLKKEVKYIGVYYVQNNKIFTDLNIRYEDFDINKNFISFYSQASKCKKIIQTKDLLRIEYYYN